MSGQGEWIGVDWGTSNVRAWHMGGSGEVLGSAASDKGMGKISKADYPGVLKSLLDQFGTTDLPSDIIVCGMAGARQGWREAAYLEVPTKLSGFAAGSVEPENGLDGFDIRILPGLSQENPADVMRGEETQILGLTQMRPGFQGVVCMPGTHSKWVDISDGKVSRFATAMTGELYEVLREHSVLRHSLSGDVDGPALEDGMSAGLEAGVSAPERLTSQLFRVRAASLLEGRGADWCSGYLSGLLVGSEVAAHKDWIRTVPVPMIGSERLSRLFGAAFKLIGVEAEAVDVTKATLSGLGAAREQLQP